MSHLVFTKYCRINRFFFSSLLPGNAFHVPFFFKRIHLAYYLAHMDSYKLFSSIVLDHIVDTITSKNIITATDNT